MTDYIFSFGTLRLDDVQRSLFGRSVATKPDSLAGWAIGSVQITDPEVIALSGTDTHPGLVRTGVATDVVEGVVLDVTVDELAAADHYERVSFERTAVTLESGTAAWVYVPRAAD